MRQEYRGGVFPMKIVAPCRRQAGGGKCTMVPFLKSKRNFWLMRPIWLALLLSLLASLPTFPQTADSSQPEGTISGTVLDEHGQPFQRRASVHLYAGRTCGIQRITR